MYCVGLLKQRPLQNIFQLNHRLIFGSSTDKDIFSPSTICSCTNCPSVSWGQIKTLRFYEHYLYVLCNVHTNTCGQDCSQFYTQHCVGDPLKENKKISIHNLLSLMIHMSAIKTVKFIHVFE